MSLESTDSYQAVQKELKYLCPSENTEAKVLSEWGFKLDPPPTKYVMDARNRFTVMTRCPNLRSYFELSITSLLGLGYLKSFYDLSSDFIVVANSDTANPRHYEVGIHENTHAWVGRHCPVLKPFFKNAEAFSRSEKYKVNKG